MRYHGSKFLRKALKTPITSVMERAKAGEEFHIDATRATPASVERIVQVTEEVLKSVTAKANTIPGHVLVSPPYARTPEEHGVARSLSRPISNYY